MYRSVFILVKVEQLKNYSKNYGESFYGSHVRRTFRVSNFEYTEATEIKIEKKEEMQ